MYGLVAVRARTARSRGGRRSAGPRTTPTTRRRPRRPARIDVTAVTGRLELVGEERREGELVAHLDTGAVGEQLVDGDLVGRVGVREATVHDDRIAR